MDLAQYVKEETKVPIIAVGGIRSVPTINEILGERKADYVFHGTAVYSRTPSHQKVEKRRYCQSQVHLM